MVGLKSTKCVICDNALAKGGGCFDGKNGFVLSHLPKDKLI